MKSTKLTDTKYLFISTTVACLENSLIEEETLAKLSDARDFDEAFRMVCDIYSARGEMTFGADEYEKMLSSELSRAYSEIDGLLESSGGEKKLLTPLRVSYDCHNLKSCIKCEALKISPDSMLVGCGNFAPEKIADMVRDRDFSCLLPTLSQACTNAIDEFSATGDPQTVDIIIDKGAFLEMSDLCRKIGLPYLSKLCETKADMCNVMTFVRCGRADMSKDILSKMLLPGGKISVGDILLCYGEKASEKLFRLFAGVYGSFSFVENASLSELEKLCDSIYLSFAQSVWMTAFGPEKPVMYMVRKENEIRNVRIVLSGKKAKLSSETIRERLRVCRK